MNKSDIWSIGGALEVFPAVQILCTASDCPKDSPEQIKRNPYDRLYKLQFASVCGKKVQCEPL